MKCCPAESSIWADVTTCFFPSSIVLLFPVFIKELHTFEFWDLQAVWCSVTILDRSEWLTQLVLLVFIAWLAYLIPRERFLSFHLPFIFADQLNHPHPDTPVIIGWTAGHNPDCVRVLHACYIYWANLMWTEEITRGHRRSILWTRLNRRSVTYTWTTISPIFPFSLFDLLAKLHVIFGIFSWLVSLTKSS